MKAKQYGNLLDSLQTLSEIDSSVFALSEIDKQGNNEKLKKAYYKSMKKQTDKLYKQILKLI